MASATGGHYLDNLCRSWSDALDDFRYTPLTAEDALPPETAVQIVLERLLQDHRDLAGHDVYVAASEQLANAAEYMLLGHGLPRSQLFVDRPAPSFGDEVR